MDQVIAHGLGETPKALILWTDAKSNEAFSAELALSFGFTDGTTSLSVGTASQNGVATSNSARRMATKLLTIIPPTSTSGVLVEAAFKSWDATNFTITWSPNTATSYVIHYIAIGGADVSAKVLNWQHPTVTGTRRSPASGSCRPSSSARTAAASPRWTRARPTAAFNLGVMDFGGAQWAGGMFMVDNGAPTSAFRGQSNDAGIYNFGNGAVSKRAVWKSMDADGFTVTYSFNDAVANIQDVTLALSGVNVHAGSFLKSTGAATAVQSLTGSGFTPSVVLLASVQDVAQATAPIAQARFGLGAASATVEGSSAVADLDAQATTSTQGIDKTSKAFVKVDNATSTINAEAHLASMDVDGFTLNWTTNDAVATQMLYLALAPQIVTEVRLLSFEAHRYDRGVLLEWRTGAELNNLGFNLYREVAGVKTKVNASLVAGSGLMVGHGAAVTAEQRYASWDLDAASADPTAVYWLEDVDFDGTSTWHGPVSPVAGGVQMPPVVVSNALGDGTCRAQSAGPGVSAPCAASDARQRFADGEAGPPRRRPAAAPRPAPDAVGPGRGGGGQDQRQASGLVPHRAAGARGGGAQPHGRSAPAAALHGGRRAGLPRGRAGRWAGWTRQAASSSSRPAWTRPRPTRGCIGWRPGGSAAASPRRGAAPGDGRRGELLAGAAVQRPVGLFRRAAERRRGELVRAAPLRLRADRGHAPPLASRPLEASRDRSGAAGVTVTAGAGPDHRVAVAVNGVELDEVAFNAQDRAVFHLALPPEVLQEGDNVVRLIARGARPTSA